MDVRRAGLVRHVGLQVAEGLVGLAQQQDALGTVQVDLGVLVLLVAGDSVVQLVSGVAYSAHSSVGEAFQIEGDCFRWGALRNSVLEVINRLLDLTETEFEEALDEA